MERSLLDPEYTEQVEDVARLRRPTATAEVAARSRKRSHRRECQGSPCHMALGSRYLALSSLSLSLSLFLSFPRLEGMPLPARWLKGRTVLRAIGYYTLYLCHSCSCPECPSGRAVDVFTTALSVPRPDSQHGKHTVSGQHSAISTPLGHSCTQHSTLVHGLRHRPQQKWRRGMSTPAAGLLLSYASPELQTKLMTDL